MENWNFIKNWQILEDDCTMQQSENSTDNYGSLLKWYNFSINRKKSITLPRIGGYPRICHSSQVLLKKKKKV